MLRCGVLYRCVRWLRTVLHCDNTKRSAARRNTARNNANGGNATQRYATKKTATQSNTEARNARRCNTVQPTQYNNLLNYLLCYCVALLYCAYCTVRAANSTVRYNEAVQ